MSCGTAQEHRSTSVSPYRGAPAPRWLGNTHQAEPNCLHGQDAFCTTGLPTSCGTAQEHRSTSNSWLLPAPLDAAGLEVGFEFGATAEQSLIRGLVRNVFAHGIGLAVVAAETGPLVVDVAIAMLAQLKAGRFEFDVPVVLMINEYTHVLVEQVPAYVVIRPQGGAGE